MERFLKHLKKQVSDVDPLCKSVIMFGCVSRKDFNFTHAIVYEQKHVCVSGFVTVGSLETFMHAVIWLETLESRE